MIGLGYAASTIKTELATYAGVGQWLVRDLAKVDIRVRFPPPAPEEPILIS